MLPASIKRTYTDVDAWRNACDGHPVVVVCQKGRKLSEGVAACLRLEGVQAEVLEGEFGSWALRANQTANQMSAAILRYTRLPDVDVNTNPDNPVIGDRSFSRDPRVVSIDADLATTSGLEAGGRFSSTISSAVSP